MSIRRKGVLTNAANGAALFAVFAVATWFGLATKARAGATADSLSIPTTVAASAPAADLLKDQVSHPVTERASLVVDAPTAVADEDKGFWLTIRPTGFEIREMTIAAGDYFVVVQNATGLRQFSLRLERESGERITEVRLPRFRKYWKEMVHLTRGRYVFSELDHPRWTCVITVTD